MLKRLGAQWSRHALSAKPAVVYPVAVCACLLIGWLLALGAAYLQDRADLQQRAVSIAHQLELQFAQANSVLARIDAIAPGSNCELTSRLLAAVVQTTPHARYALRTAPDGRVCSSDISRIDNPPAVAAGSSLILRSNQAGSPVFVLQHQGNGGSMLELGAASLAALLQPGSAGVVAGVRMGAQYLAADGTVRAADDAIGQGLSYQAATQDGLLEVVVQESWAEVLLHSVLRRLDTLLLAALAGVALGWALLRRQLARNSSSWEIAQGIRNREFFTHYQPIVTAEHGECIGVEVLARWRHPVQGAIRSDLFIPAAEDAGLIVPLTRYLIRRVSKEFKQVALPPGFLVGINIAAEHLGMPDLVEDCKILLAVLREKKAVLVLEVSERFPLPEHQVTHRVVQDLRQMGVKLALDDFGIGHADRNYLRRWGFDYLKVEKGYVSALGKDSFKANILDGLLQTSHQLGVQVIVKGVETQGQQNYLSVKGFQFLQGFYFGKPMTLNHFRQWLYSGITQDRVPSAATMASSRSEATDR